jgi:hypothetical protein
MFFNQLIVAQSTNNFKKNQTRGKIILRVGGEGVS